LLLLEPELKFPSDIIEIEYFEELPNSDVGARNQWPAPQWKVVSKISYKMRGKL